MWLGVKIAVDRSAFDLARGDRRYVNVARFVAEHTDPNAVIFSRQHSGSLRLYAGRLTLRWDVLDAPWLDGAVAYLQSVGRRPYFVLEGDEAEEFKARFAGSSTLGALAWRPMAQLSTPPVFVYDPIDRQNTAEPLAISSIGESRDRRCYLPYEAQAFPPPLALYSGELRWPRQSAKREGGQACQWPPGSPKGLRYLIPAALSVFE